jgi:hypothetical protein
MRTDAVDRLAHIGKLLAMLTMQLEFNNTVRTMTPVLLSYHGCGARHSPIHFDGLSAYPANLCPLSCGVEFADL